MGMVTSPSQWMAAMGTVNTTLEAEIRAAAFGAEICAMTRPNLPTFALDNIQRELGYIEDRLNEVNSRHPPGFQVIMTRHNRVRLIARESWHSTRYAARERGRLAAEFEEENRVREMTQMALHIAAG